MVKLYQLGPQYMGSLQAPELNGNHIWHIQFTECQFHVKVHNLNFHNSVFYEGWNFNSGNYLFTTDAK